MGCVRHVEKGGRFGQIVWAVDPSLNAKPSICETHPGGLLHLLHRLMMPPTNGTVDRVLIHLFITGQLAGSSL
jgi:hypothetical protein